MDGFLDFRGAGEVNSGRYLGNLGEPLGNLGEAAGPPIQATGPAQIGAGLGIGKF